MDETVVLVIFLYISDQKRVDSAVNIDEPPELVKDWLIESYSQNNCLEHFLRLFGDHEDSRVDFGKRDGCLRVERVLKDGMLLVYLFTKDMSEYLASSFEIQYHN